ncbi:hypothetical protein ASG45_06300 [Microbacterium sp. Leaf436]|nr:hypothetical protein ASG45_06300 [Microbacterium sp. Leaf436]
MPLPLLARARGTGMGACHVPGMRVEARVSAPAERSRTAHTRVEAGFSAPTESARIALACGR